MAADGSAEEVDSQTTSVAGRWRETAILLAMALVAEACYLWGFVLPYSLTQHYKTPLLDLAGINHSSADSFNFFALTWVFSFFAYALALARCPARPGRSFVLVVGLAGAAFSLTLLFMYPTGAADLLDYIGRARILAHYGDNPWLYMPAEAKYLADPFRPYVGGWAGTTSPYGPIWELLAAGASLLGGANLLLNLLLFKGLVIAAYGASCVLVYMILQRVQPTWAARGLLCFAWNPLLLFETAGNGHNDMVMVAFMLLAFYLATFSDWRLLASPAALALGALVKFVPALLLPLLLVLLWRSEWNRGGIGAEIRALTRVLAGGAIFVAVSVLVYAPFWIGPQTIGALWRRDLFTASIPNVVKDYLIDNRQMEAEPAMALVRTAALIITVLIVLIEAGRLLWPRAEDDERTLALRLFAGSYRIIFVYLIFATLWFQPWYQLWLIPLAALAARRSYLPRTIAVNVGGVANYFVWDYLVIWNNSWGSVVQWTAALVVNLPPLLVTAYQTLAPRSVNEERVATRLPVRPVRAQAGAEEALPPARRRSGSAHERANTGNSTHL